MTTFPHSNSRVASRYPPGAQASPTTGRTVGCAHSCCIVLASNTYTPASVPSASSIPSGEGSQARQVPNPNRATASSGITPRPYTASMPGGGAGTGVAVLVGPGPRTEVGDTASVGVTSGISVLGTGIAAVIVMGRWVGAGVHVATLIGPGVGACWQAARRIDIR